MKNDVILSFQAYSLRRHTFADTLMIAAKLGFPCIEAYPGQLLGGGLPGTTDYHTMSDETRAKFKQMLAAQPVKLVSYGVTGARNDAEWSRLTTFCRDLGIKLIVIEAGQSRAVYDLAEKHAKLSGIKVGLHNHTQAGGRPRPMLDALAGRSAAIGASADVGHWARSGTDAAKGMELIKGHFHAIHLVDVAPASAGSRDLPLGAGIIDVKRVLDTLAAQGGTVYATVEYETESPTLISEIAACVRYFRAWQRGEITNDNKVATRSIAAIWRGVAKASQPDTWSNVGFDPESQRQLEKSKQLRRLTVDLATVKSNKPGANPQEIPEMAFSEDAKRKFCHLNWTGYTYVSCALKEVGAAKIYTVSSANGPSTRDPVNWRLQGSLDGQKWFTLDTRKDQFFPTRHFLKAFAIRSPRPCKYLKFEVLAHGGDRDMEFSRLGFFA